MTTPDIARHFPDHLRGTANFYAKNADLYAQATRDLDMSAIYARFLKYLKPGSRILDAGSGSGRDTREFLKRGYVVEAFDASEPLAALSSKFTGIQTRVLRFEDFDESECFDGIWACAALLHVPRVHLKDALARLVRALRPSGVLYASFKLGDTDRIADDGRAFTDLDEGSLLTVVKQLPYELRVCDLWQSLGEGDRKGRNMWLNVVLQRCS